MKNFRGMAILVQAHRACGVELPDAESYEHDSQLTGPGFSPEECLLQGARTLSLIALSSSYDGPLEMRALRLFRTSQTTLAGLDAAGIADTFDILDPGLLQLQLQETFGPDNDTIGMDQRGNTLLHFAAAAGQFQSAEIILESGSPVDVANLEGETPLFHAMRNAETEAALLLLARGADPLYKTKNCCTPLHYLGAFRGPELALLVDALREPKPHSVDIDSAKYEAVPWHYYVALALGTPLHWALNRQNLEAASYLLEFGANPLLENGRGCSPLYYAIYNNMYTFLELFAEGEKPWVRSVRADISQHAAAYAKDVMRQDDFHGMLVHGAEFSQCRNKTVATLQRVVAPADITGPLLWSAANWNRLEQASNLLDSNADSLVDFKDIHDSESSLRRTIQHGDREMFDLLIKHNPDVNAPQEPHSFRYLHLLCGFLIPLDDMVYFADRLLEAGADINAVGDTGCPPIWYALEQGRIELAQTLYEHGARFAGTDNEGLTLLGYLILHASPPIPDIFDFFSAHCPPEMKDEAVVNQLNGHTALHIAAMRGGFGDDETWVKALQMRLLSPALFSTDHYLNCQDHSGNTPLHVAAEKGNPTMVRLLLEAGADRELANSQGETPLAVALARPWSQERERLGGSFSFEGVGAGRTAAEMFDRDTAEVVALLEEVGVNVMSGVLGLEERLGEMGI
jgi:ankyrin repeat protein